MSSSKNLLLISSFIYVSITLGRRHFLIETKDEGHVDLHGLQTQVLPMYVGGGDGMDYGAYQCNGVALICHTEGKKEGQTLQEDGCHFE